MFCHDKCSSSRHVFAKRFRNCFQGFRKSGNPMRRASAVLTIVLVGFGGCLGFEPDTEHVGSSTANEQSGAASMWIPFTVGVESLFYASVSTNNASGGGERHQWSDRDFAIAEFPLHATDRIWVNVTSYASSVEELYIGIIVDDGMTLREGPASVKRVVGRDSMTAEFFLEAREPGESKVHYYARETSDIPRRDLTLFLPYFVNESSVPGQ